MKILKYSSILFSKLIGTSIFPKFQKHSIFSNKSFTHPKSCISLISASRCISFTNSLQSFTPKSGKLFQEFENQYAHEVMEKLVHYSNSLLENPLKTDKYPCCGQSFELLCPFDQFAEVTINNLTDGLSIENRKFSSLVKEICSSLPQASDYDVQRTLYHLCLWPQTPKTYTPNFKALWNTLDEECVKRLINWDVSHKLLIADYWFYLKLSRITQYNGRFIASMVESIEALTSPQVVQLMFYVNLQRKFPQYYLPSLEKKLESIINLITIEEISVICLGYFKTKNKISNPIIIQSIVKQLILNLETAGTVTVAAILKFLRKSKHLSLIDTYISTMHKCIPYIKKWDIPTAVHLALLSSECNVYHPLLLNSVTKKITEEIAHSRIKDCTKFLQCLSHFNHFVKGRFHDLVFAEIQKDDRQEEVTLYPKEIVYLSLYYAYMGHFNYSILSKIFDKQFFKWCSSNYHETLPSFAEIDCCIEIECKDYSGPRLDRIERKILESRKGNVPSKSLNQNMQTRLIGEVYESLVEILGSSKNVLIKHILPHNYSADIIVRLVSKNEKPLSDVCQNFRSDAILTPPSNEVWASFMVCGMYSFAYRSKHMTGITAMKLRQLQMIGYHVIFIPFYEIPQYKLQRNHFLKEHLNVLEEKYQNKVCC